MYVGAENNTGTVAPSTSTTAVPKACRASCPSWSSCRLLLRVTMFSRPGSPLVTETGLVGREAQREGGDEWTG